MSAGQTKQAIAVLGAGSWGTALAILLARNDHPVLLWGLAEEISQLQQERENKTYLPGIEFPDRLRPIADLDEIMAQVRDILLAVPSHAFRGVLQQLKPLLHEHARVAWASKGLEQGTAKFLHQIAGEVLGQRAFAVISGPTFAKEVARGLPTAMTVASNDAGFAHDLAEHLHSSVCRCYTSSDMIGVGLGGAVKNVLAIAAGISDGLGYGANSRAALITRGLAEIMRLGDAVGGERETFMGLAGLGDLVLTCTDDQSRNRRFGLALARGASAEQAMRQIGQVVEGYQTAREVARLIKRHEIDMPICDHINRVLFENLTAQQAVRDLFARELKPEFG